MNSKLSEGLFIFLILGFFILGLALITKHFGFALIFSQHLFGLIILGTIIYILGLRK